ncbi:MAG: hypothetical protein WBA93_23240 [Microcoleaceae cyanobacterium]
MINSLVKIALQLGFEFKFFGQTLQAGDNAAITQETNIKLAATIDNTEILLFNLAYLFRKRLNP